MKDTTTFQRFERQFSKESHLRTAYHKNCDYSLQMTPELRDSIEKDVIDWLDNKGVESPTFSLDLAPGNKTITFTRAEVAYKIASNNWKIIHIAESGFWPRLLSSKPKLLIQHPPEFITLKNEIRDFGYGEEERHECRIAESMLERVAEEIKANEVV